LKTKYSTILFDLGNTLIRFDHNIAVKKLFSRFGIDPKTTYDLFFDSRITRLFEKGMILPDEFHKRATGLLGIDIAYDEFADIWNDIFWEDTGSCALARELKKEYRLFLLSNVNKVHFEYIQSKFDIISIFDELILSYKVGVMKPEPAIFEYAIKQSGGDKTKVIYIDDREDLIREATSMGIESIRYESSGKLKEDLAARGVLKSAA
jgi:putative hydrolase of the HAD superfamily